MLLFFPFLPSLVPSLSYSPFSLSLFLSVQQRPWFYTMDVCTIGGERTLRLSLKSVCQTGTYVGIERSSLGSATLRIRSVR